MRTLALVGTLTALAGAALLGASERGWLPRAARSDAPFVAAAVSTRAGLSLRPSAPRFLAPSTALMSRADAILAGEEAPQDRECVGQTPDRFYEFYFTRAIYSSNRGRGNRGFGGRNSGGGSWSVDYPKADCQFISVVQRLAGLDMFYDSNAINLDDTRIRSFPFLYALEVGGMALSDQEAEGLRSYLAAGGFLVIDDFWGTQEWRNFQREITRVLPEFPIVEIPLDHELFGIFYNIDEILQVPNVGNGRAYSRGCRECTSENDGYVPQVFGIFDKKGRLMVLINFNTDMGDAWEWAEVPDYPIQFSTHAFEMGVNMILYSMTH
jgi:hypothetical protein